MAPPVFLGKPSGEVRPESLPASFAHGVYVYCGICSIDIGRSVRPAPATPVRGGSWSPPRSHEPAPTHRTPIDAGGVSERWPTPRSHESRARREAVGRPRAGRPSSAPRTRHDGYFEGRGYQVTWALGHLVTLKEPQDYDPALKRWSLETLAVRARAVRAQAPRREGGRQAVRGRQAPVPRRRRADLRHRRRPRGRADLPLHPGADRLHRQAGPAALAQLADRGRHPRRLRAACGRCPTTTRCTPRPAAAARPTGSSA